MRIGINATSFNDRPSGARQRLVRLYGALFRLRPDHDYWIYEPSDCCVAEWFGPLPNVRGISTPLPGSDRWKRRIMGMGYWHRQLSRDRLNLFETLHLPLIRAPDCPTLVTVHDARSVLPEVPPLRRALNRRVLRHALLKADQVITVSETMRLELAAIEPLAKIATIFNGIDPTPCQVDVADRGRLVDGFSLQRDFLLAVGHFEPRKNYSSLIAAFKLLRLTHPGLGLAIVGQDGGTLAETEHLVRRCKLSDSVRLLHDVDDQQLARLYRAARMVVFPSTYEGFGIPVLEAMAAGRPLALSDLPVFRELTEDRACYFPPHDAVAMAAVIGALLASPERQREFEAYGKNRVGDFAFAKLAGQLDGLHLRLAADRAAFAGHSPPRTLS